MHITYQLEAGAPVGLLTSLIIYISRQGTGKWLSFSFNPWRLFEVFAFSVLKNSSCLQRPKMAHTLELFILRYQRGDCRNKSYKVYSRK